MMLKKAGVCVWVVTFTSLISFMHVCGDLCTDYDDSSTTASSKLLSKIHQSATPRGGPAAGTYLKDPSSGDLAKCTVSCCARSDCNTVFLHDTVCYLIVCNVTNPENCEPKQRHGEKFKDTYMLNLRTIEETTMLQLQQTTYSLLGGEDQGTSEVPVEDTDIQNECVPDTNKGCGIHEVCEEQFPEIFMCACMPGYAYSKTTQMCAASAVHTTITSTTLRHHPSGPTVCLVAVVGGQQGEESCYKHEVCVPTASGSIQGTCECVQGYSPDRDTGWCVFAKLTSILTTLGNSKGTTTTALPKTRSGDLSCEVGIINGCVTHEQCLYLNNRSRHGKCDCKSGFTRNAKTNYCELITESHHPTTATTKASIKSAITTTVPDSTSPSQTTTVAKDKVTVKKKGDSSKEEEIALANTTQSSTTVTTPKPTSTSTAKPQVQPILVSAGLNQVIQLPVNSVMFTASTTPLDTKGVYTYHWSLVSHPDGKKFGEMDGINTPKLKLTKLIAGIYTFKVSVTKEGGYGDATVNVTVLPLARQNSPPKAIIRPAHQEVHSPNDLLLDGSESSDDDKIVKYHWEAVSGPLGTTNIEEDLQSKSTLVMKGLQSGSYKFKLTVTDSDGVENSTFANVTVIKEIDYPPKANAGSNVIMSLPQKSVTLYGNASTDDKGIVSYEWIKKSDKLTADMTGSVTPILHLENLEVGDYTFTLKVTDASGQTDTADVHVFVKAEVNKPPVAVVGPDKVVLLPSDTVVLDGSNSTDDQKVATYKWEQVGGHTAAVIDNADRAVATASKLKNGEYKFKLTVTDAENLQGEGTLTVTVKENQNKPPEANAGGDQRIHLPAHFVALDGSKSKDDKGIVSWTWTRNGNSLAAGYILNNSDHHAVLQLSSLVSGRYIFTLEVRDAEGLTDSDTAHMVVESDMNDLDLVELQVKSDIRHFREDNKVNLENQLALMIGKKGQDLDTKVKIQDIEMDRKSGNMLLTFYVIAQQTADTVTGNKQPQQETWDGPSVVNILRSKLEDRGIVDLDIISLDTVVCQNNCSGHGQCNQATKMCVCEAFWMQDFFQAFIFSQQSNCDWSILYVIIISFVIVVTLSAVMWACVCVLRKWYKARPKKRHRYQLLEEVDDDRDSLELLPKVEHKDGSTVNNKMEKGKIQNTSIMVSESDFSTDEETLFVSSKVRKNGHLKNGLLKAKQRTKIRT